MSEPLTVVKEGPSGKYVEVCLDGKLYKFARNEQGQVRCFWWEGQFDLNAVRYLNQFAAKALNSHYAESPRGAAERPIPAPIGLACIHCGNQFHQGGQVSDVCPGCGENPFE